VKRGWETHKLGQVCDLIARGIAPKYVEDGLLVLNQRCIRGHRVDFEFARRHNLSLKSPPADRFIRIGDVLVNSTGEGTLGRVAQVREEPSEPTTVDTHVTIVRPQTKRFYSDFFGYMLIFIEDQIAASGEGASGQTELSRTTLSEKFAVSFPTSHDEQKRIVAILDEAFEGLDRAAANAKKNLANARELFDSHLNSMFLKLSEGLSRHPLDSLCGRDRIITYGVIKLGDEISSGVPCLRTSNVRRLRIDTAGMKRIAPSLSQDYKRTILQGGEVLVNVRGTLGGVAVADAEMEGWNVSREIAVVPADKHRVSPAYLSYFVATSESQKWLSSVEKGATYRGINLEDLRTLFVPLPDMRTQLSVVEQCDSLLSDTRQLEQNYETKVAALAELRQAVLQRAFAGDLTERLDLAA